MKKAAAVLAVFCVLTMLSGCGKPAAPAKTADENAMAYVGVWETGSLEISSKAGTTSDKKSRTLEIPVSLRLDADLTGDFTVGENRQTVDWEVRTSETVGEYLVVTLREHFWVENLELDPEHLQLVPADPQGLRMNADWKSQVGHGVRLIVDGLLEKAE